MAQVLQTLAEAVQEVREELVTLGALLEGPR